MENQANDKESTSYVTPSWELETIPCVGHCTIRVRQRSSVFTHFVFQRSIPRIQGLISSCGCIIKWIRTMIRVLGASQPKQKEMRQATKAEILKWKSSWQKNAVSSEENDSLKLMLPKPVPVPFMGTWAGFDWGSWRSVLYPLSCNCLNWVHSPRDDWELCLVSVLFALWGVGFSRPNNTATLLSW